MWGYVLNVRKRIKVGKNKLARWAEMEQMDFVLQPRFEEIYKKDYVLKGRWGEDFFHNEHPIVLELGCGKGEYTVGLAEKFPEKNFIGIDIKGARMWRGAVTTLDKGLKNVAFLRSRIELLHSFFDRGEVSEIWITFPDPQPRKRREKKRLTHPRFLEVYRNILKPGGYVHLKTDNVDMFQYSLEVIRLNDFPLEECTTDLYGEKKDEFVFGIRTFYEKKFLEEGKKICYLRFVPVREHPLKNPVHGE